MLHKYISHFALGHTWASHVVRAGCVVSIVGVSVPMRALKSPHRIVSSCGWMPSNACSSWAVAWASVMSRFAKEDVGGKYTFAMFTRWLFGSLSLTCRQYSLPVVLSMCNEFRTNVARPPRAPTGRRFSTILYPFSRRGSACSAIQVSCKQRTSNSSYSRRDSSFRCESPRTFVLPTVIPSCCHRYIIFGWSFGKRRDPFVRLIAFAA